ncbi:AfsR/SARP family transcriptional regulator [Deinococcus multiflagellatus]|uniref:BTAD domain-containing putative transcriptional regulator n=1 Tax=Deinococcus multiflagellatus TaxID=1656887 RepID=A0ABW1ZSL3_9DEIO|nr:BTAD domain-containing putative transcriptional regulator [Deinococcus multiflagellatus]MBZ9713572.1 response regulator receiver protein [Deinococcus multiflagellatus]
MTQLILRSLGRAEVLRGGQPVKWEAESARDLVFYLMAHPEGRTREDIISALWREDQTARSGNRFRVTLHRARAGLGAPGCITEAYGAYRLSDEVLRASDVFRLYAALAEAEHSEGEARFLALGRAIAEYGGDFLPHLQAEWVLPAREEHQAAYTRACLERSVLHCEHLHCELAVQDLVAALRRDPFLGENHHQKLMTCLSVVEDKYAATEHYRRFVRFLRDDLKDAPMPETVVLAERIKRGERLCEHGQKAAAPLLRSCPLTSDGRCPGPYAELLNLA